MTIPDIDFVNGEIILGKIGDIHRFSEPKKLLAFAGLDPSVHQSGNFQAKRTRISKRGSRVLRYALMNAAHNVVKNNATFKAYYDVKECKEATTLFEPFSLAFIFKYISIFNTKRQFSSHISLLYIRDKFFINLIFTCLNHIRNLTYKC